MTFRVIQKIKMSKAAGIVTEMPIVAVRCRRVRLLRIWLRGRIYVKWSKIKSQSNRVNNRQRIQQETTIILPIRTKVKMIRIRYWRLQNWDPGLAWKSSWKSWKPKNRNLWNQKRRVWHVWRSLRWHGQVTTRRSNWYHRVLLVMLLLRMLEVLTKLLRSLLSNLRKGTL